MADSVFIGRVSFSPGFSDGFETQNRLFLSASYTINIPFVSASSVSSINATATPLNLSALYSLIQTNAINGNGIVTSANVLSASYGLNAHQINAYVNIPVNTLSASYNLNSINVNSGPKVYVSSLTESYNLNSINVKSDANVFTDIISAVFNLNDPNIIESFGYTVSANNISAVYNLENISINTTVKNLSNALSAFYNVEDANVKGYAFTSADILNSNYELSNPTISIRTTATANILNLAYSIEDPNIKVVTNYTFSANTISGAYNLNNSEVIIAIPNWINDVLVPWNDYWRDDTECKDNERDLYSNLATDMYNKFACTWVYYPTTYNITYDRVFKEDQNRFVVRAFSAMGFVEDIPAEHKSWQLEGIVGLDIVKAYFTIDHFAEASTYSGTSSGIYGTYQPSVGDICYLTPNNVFYEVINVKSTVEQFLNRPNNYEFTLRVFRDNKMTVSANNPTLPFTDPIYTVVTSAQSATENFHDYLAINADVDVLISAVEYRPKPGEKTQDAFSGW